MGADDVKNGDTKEILFNISKKEVGNPQSTYKKFHRKLKGDFSVSVNKESITLERLQSAHLVVFAGPREMFTEQEFIAIKEYLGGGGSVFILLGEGGEGKYETNVNYLIEEYGISINNDAVVRSVYLKYHHPKETLITHGILCQDIVRTAKGEKKKGKENKEKLNLNITQEDGDGVRDVVVVRELWLLPSDITDLAIIQVQKPSYQGIHQLPVLLQLIKFIL
mmetsp:Transcript_7824/g.10878  ORF Transcript_7824/g.10878 Transcript_7824/m.10878 type:complete len:222 (+) Transcript_7824:104-769(+)